MKKCSFLALLLILCTVFSSCTMHGQKVITYGVKIFQEKDIFYTITNNPEEERFEIFYEKDGGDKTFNTYFSFSLSKDGQSIWNTYGLSNNEQVAFVVSCSDDTLLSYEKNSYIVKGETTVYLSYKDLPEDIKEYFKLYPDSDTNLNTYNIYFNGYYMVSS